MAWIQPALKAADPFAEHVRSTPWLSPAASRQAFELPEGFEVQLVAAEPDILKPMNLAFDGRGRLWVTVTREYPYAAPLDRPGRDAIKVLEDTDGDGRADRIETFAEGLNIPIGLLPYKNGVIAWSIPNIWYFEDKDGDGRSDQRTKLFGPLGYERDTHGMNASFRRGFDGWVYATHGFNNQSTLVAGDGSRITMQSGNTYRFRPDASRVEQHTWGQVNPFGLCFDAWGNLFSADCHSAPIYQLLAGGYYPSFGKPHDGLGFAPVMMRHSHGSTALCGIVRYEDDLWPETYRGNIFIGNVMTSRVNHDTLERTGSTFTAKEMPDLLRTSDPWFRPVDLRLGPDGALYVADFYNRIIGHYEVPLDHPGRDRTSGRIWRIVYRGEDGAAGARPRRDLTQATPEALWQALEDPNLTYRLLAMNEWTDRLGPRRLEILRRGLADAETAPRQKGHALWILERLGALDSELLLSALAEKAPQVRVHALRILAGRRQLEAPLLAAARRALQDEHLLARRCAAEVLSAHPSPENLSPLLASLIGVPGEDTHTRYVVRKALRDQLLVEGSYQKLATISLGPEDQQLMAGISLAVKTPASALFLLEVAAKDSTGRDRLADYLRHAARYVPAGRESRLAELGQRILANDPGGQMVLFESVQAGYREREMVMPPSLRAWGEKLAAAFLQGVPLQGWRYQPIDPLGPLEHPWDVERRDAADGVSGEWFLSSLPAGEAKTGKLLSRVFEAPASLRFFLAGHDGYPDQPAQGKNLVRLREVGTGRVWREQPAPRQDVAQEVVWDLSEGAGREVQLEVVDGDAAGAYAWIAAGRFEPPLVRVPDVSPRELVQRQARAVGLVADLKLKSLGASLVALVANRAADPVARSAAISAVSRIGLKEGLMAVRGVLTNRQELAALRLASVAPLVREGSKGALTEVREAIRLAPQGLQDAMAARLAGSKEGAALLLDWVAEGSVAAPVLQDRLVREKILAAQPKDAEARLEALTRTLSPREEALARLLDRKVEGYLRGEEASLVRGKEVFAKQCAGCHQIGGEGGLVGPQLDGIGGRGLERLVEDILDPNRNVDQAFRSTTFTLKDGDIISGLVRRNEGGLLVYADATGQERTLAIKEIEGRFPSDVSLMPDNYADVLTPGEFNDLLAFLLAQRVGPAE